VQVLSNMPSAFGGIGVDVAAGVLGGVNFSDSPNDLQLYLLSGNANRRRLFNQAFFGSVNINSQLNAATALKAGKAWVGRQQRPRCLELRRAARSSRDYHERELPSGNRRDDQLE